MELKVTPSILILLVSLMFADARQNMVPLMHMQEGEFTCNSCLEASRKAERTLKQMNLLKEFDMLSSEVCHALPSNFEAQCMEKSRIQINHTNHHWKNSLTKSLCGSTDCASTSACQKMKLRSSWRTTSPLG
ncbi:hypothetical protein KSP39_PZI020448 [Platanthera zijinensis]|uniref:Saposin B-type domain-containing protein n=1 Tax=Platanthera zijinensis TaxID=2320716 RepID=A0AAP0B002_9ASPA